MAYEQTVGKYVTVVDKFVVEYEITTWCLCHNLHVQFERKTDKEHICILLTNYKSTVTRTAMVRNFEGTCQRSMMYTESVCNVKLFTEINK